MQKRKLIVFNMVSLDGFFEGPNKELDWHHVDNEFQEFAIEQLQSADMLLFGRTTYELMSAYWTTRTAIANDPIVAELMNSLPKTVVSNTIEKPEWNNTRLINKNVVGEISRLKRQSGKNIFILGSANLISTLRKASIIDEYRMMICPILLSNGNPHFKSEDGKLNLKLIRTKIFSSGNILLCYEPDLIANK